MNGKGAWVVCSATDEEWYKYTTIDKRWANVMLSDGKYTTDTAKVGMEISEDELGSMFVWIPRYAYKITKGYRPEEVTEGEIDIKFLIGTTDKSVDKIKIVDYNATTTNNYKSFPDGYVVHPAFSNNVSAGGGDKELTGLWVAKFEAGYPMQDNRFDNNTNTVTIKEKNFKYPVFKGQRYSYNETRIEDCYLISQNLFKDNNNPYGVGENLNSHMMKNSEWGAIAYLSQSEYGKNEEIYENNLSFGNISINGLSNVNAMTGYSSDIAKGNVNNVNSTTPIDDIMEGINSYKSYVWYYTDKNSTKGNGTKASTTGNIYGIYDLSGGCWEYMAGVMPTEHSSILNNGGNTFNDVKKSSKYLTVYPIGNSTKNETDISRSYFAWKSFYGDAIYETSVGAGSDNSYTSWYGELSDEDTLSNEPFLIRGGSLDYLKRIRTFCLCRCSRS